MSTSFLGGRRGASLNIVQSYPTEENLKESFKESTCLVPHGAYAIVLNASNLAEHGKLFKREFDNSAKFMGNIAGPAGPKVEADLYLQDNDADAKTNAQAIAYIREKVKDISAPYVVAYGSDSNRTRFFAYMNKQSSSDTSENDWVYLGEYSEHISITTNSIDTDSFSLGGKNSIRLYLTMV